jgi:hypothetical protein
MRRQAWPDRRNLAAYKRCGVTIGVIARIAVVLVGGVIGVAVRCSQAIIGSIVPLPIYHTISGATTGRRVSARGGEG